MGSSAAIPQPKSKLKKLFNKNKALFGLIYARQNKMLWLSDSSKNTAKGDKNEIFNTYSQLIRVFEGKPFSQIIYLYKSVIKIF